MGPQNASWSEIQLATPTVLQFSSNSVSIITIGDWKLKKPLRFMIELKLTPKMWLPIDASLSHFGCLGMGISGGWECFQICNFIEMCVALGPNTNIDIKLELGRNACALCILNAFTFVSTRLKYLRIFFLEYTIYIRIWISRSVGRQIAWKPNLWATIEMQDASCSYFYIYPHDWL